MRDEDKDEKVEHWRELIRQTEDMINEWKDIDEESPYYNQIYKSWENFIEKQKEELHYHMRRTGSTIDREELD
jgi:hypothetical protein